MERCIISLNRISYETIPSTKREHKGKSLLDVVSNYTIIDIETTGLDPHYDEIIEISAIKIQDNTIVDTFSSLIKPTDVDIPEFITDLTGITPAMLKTAPSFKEVEEKLLNFLSDNILIGHNANFDINFLYDYTDGKLTNNFIDTLRLSRWVLPNLPHHRLSDLCQHYDIINENAHRALSDCQTTFVCYQQLCNDLIKKFNSVEEFQNMIKARKYTNAKDITTDKVEFDETHPLFGKHCVFTGTLEKFVRKDAMQIVADLGGICQNSVTNQTNYLILGNNDYCTQIKDGKSSKQKKAEALKLKGNDIEIISENVFYDMIAKDNE